MEVKDYKDKIKITPEEKETIKKNSPYALPLNPTAQGFSGAEVRKKLYQAIVGESGSILALLDRLVESTTDELNSLVTDIEDDKLSKIWTDIAEQTTTNLNDILVFNRGDKVYKTTLANLLAHSAGVDLFETVAELPEKGQPNKIYFVPSNDQEVQNTFDEYIWINEDWEKIGSVTIDLSNYYTKNETFSQAQVNNFLEKKVDKVAGKQLSTNDFTTAEKNKLSGIQAGAQVNAVTSVAGKTGSVVLSKSDVGLSNVDNTSDLNKPISNATKTALNNKADKTELFSGSYNDLNDKPTIPTKTSQLTNDNNYVDKDFVNSKLVGVYEYKGSVSTFDNLPKTDLTIGDVYDVKDTGVNYAWNGAEWDSLGGFATVDLSNYYTVNETFNKNEINYFLDKKSNIGHDHDDAYYQKYQTYTAVQVNNLLLDYSKTNHNHDDNYYKKTEVDNLLNSKQELDFRGAFESGATYYAGDIVYSIGGDAGVGYLYLFTRDVANKESLPKMFDGYCIRLDQKVDRLQAEEITVFGDKTTGTLLGADYLLISYGNNVYAKEFFPHSIQDLKWVKEDNKFVLYDGRGKLASTKDLFSGIYNDLADKPTIPTKTSQLTNDSGLATETYVNNKVSSVYEYKGSVATFDDLPTTNRNVGDVYDVQDTGMNYAWNGTEWDGLGTVIDLSNYYQKTETYSKTRVNDLLSVKSDKTHNHDNQYAVYNHNHDRYYAAINHKHDDKYYQKNETFSQTEVNSLLKNKVDTEYLKSWDTALFDKLFLFYGGYTTQTIKKADLDDLSSLNTSASYGEDIDVIAVDDTHVYVGGETTTTVKKYLKSDLSYVGEVDNDGETIRSIAVDDTHIYVGSPMSTTVRKYLKDDLSYIGGTTHYGGLIYSITIDDTYLYAGSQMIVRKYLKSDLSYVGETPEYSMISSIAVDETYLYIGGYSKVVRKYLKSDLSYVGETDSYGDLIFTIALDGKYLYVGGQTTQTVRKYLKSDLSLVGESPNYGRSIRAIAVDGTYVYVGGQTQTVRKYLKSDLAYVGESPNYGGDIRSIAIG